MKRKRHFLIRTALALFMVLCSTMGWGQVTIAFNGAEATGTTLTTSINEFVPSSTNTGTPSNQRIKNGSQSFQQTLQGTRTLITNGVPLNGYVSNFVEVWNAMISTSTGNGIDGSVDKLEIFVSETSVFNATPDVTVNSSSNNIRWGMTGTGTISTMAGTPVTHTYTHTNTNGTTKTGADAYSKIIIDIPNTWNNVFIKIVTVNNADAEVWCIDDIAVKGVVGSTCQASDLAFTNTTVSQDLSAGTYTQTATSSNGTTGIIYSSSDETVATVDAATGVVAMLTAGTTTITATQAEGTHNATLYCTGTATYDLTISSSAPSLVITGAADHGSACVGASLALQTYTITNSGNSAASGLTVISSDTQFAVSNLSATTVSGSNGTVTFDVTFTPTSAGTQNATITVQSSTSGTNVATFDVTGTGESTANPVLAAQVATAISATGATLNGEITSLGNCLTSTIDEQGFVYGTTSNPESNGGTYVSDGTATAGTFDVVLNSLSPATTYYYKAYVKDGNNQYYYSTNEETFITTLDAPTAVAASNISHNGFTANWNAVAGADSYVLEVNEVSGSVTPNVTVVGWDFEDSNQTSDSGITANNNRLITTNSTGTIVYNVAGGNTSASAISNSDWNGGADSKYWQISFATIGMSSLKLSSAQRSSNTGPRDFKIQYSLDGSSWNDVSLASITIANNWTTGVVNNIALPSACDNQTLVYLRWIMTSNTSVNLGSVASTGTNSIDDIIITGDQGTFISTPVIGSPFTITAPATSYDVTGLNPDSDYTYTVKAVKGAVESAVSNTINVTTSPAPASTTYAGGSWTNGAPNSPDTDAVISENYNGAGFTAKDITVSSGAALTITSTETITAANITVEDNANFIQEDGSTLNLTGGTLTLNKAATSAADKYVFWSSPVQNQNVYDIYPAGTPQFVMTYDSNTDLYPVVGNPSIGYTAIAGVGYSVKVPASANAAQFTGTPNNGPVTVTLDADGTDNVNGNTWNLIGNPYPSNLNLQSLYSGGLNGIDSSIYFWDNISATNTTQQQAATTWAVFNAAGGTWSSKGGLGIDDNSLVKPGQGFIVQATAPSITFTNAMRSAATANFINKGMNPGEGKFWLKLATPSGTQFQTAITYGGGALNTLEAFDSKVMSVGANGIYSYLGTDKLAIQGRDYFVNTDVVILGNKHSASGQYTFSLAGKTGLFDAGQAIFLRDKQTNIYTNLQTDSYTFVSDALEQQDRFEIVYQPQAALGTAETVKTETVVYKDGDHFTVKASEKILSIEVYDAAGRHIGTVKPDSTTAQVTVGSRGMYLLKIKTVNSETVKKVIK